MLGQKFNYKVVLLAMTHQLAIAAAEMIKWGVKTWGEGRRLCFPWYRMLDKCEPGDTYGKRRVANFFFLAEMPCGTVAGVSPGF
ncbi:hypothetical protein J3E69DRAFT_338791 [Trichoderma sp. SZMC 28015]